MDFKSFLDPSNKLQLFSFAAIILLLSGTITLFKDNETKKDDEYKVQNQIHPDEFFNTTPRIKDKERVIVILKGDEVVKQTEELDNKGRVVKRKEEVISKNHNTKRDGQYLRTGEELKNGDIISEQIFTDENGNILKKQEVFEDGKIITKYQPIEQGSNVEYLKPNADQELQEIASNNVIIDNQDYKIKKYLDKDGNIVNKLFDAQGREVMQSASGEVFINNKKYNLDDIVKKFEGRLFNFKEERKEFDQNALKKHQYLRSQAKGNFKILKTDREKEQEAQEAALNNKKYQILSQDDNFDEHQEPKTTASYPVDLTRVITIAKSIPATLIDEIKSEIPGKVVKAQIEQNVYASHGRKILIPKGSIAIGSFDQLQDRNATRMYIAWYRIITPVGINIKLEGHLSDAKGASGLAGEVDRRLVDRYGMAFMLSILNAAAQISVPVDDIRLRAGADSFTREFSAVTGQLIRESLKVLPIITIPQGSRINISPLQDIWFKDPEKGEVRVKPYQIQS